MVKINCIDKVEISLNNKPVGCIYIQTSGEYVEDRVKNTALERCSHFKEPESLSARIISSIEQDYQVIGGSTYPANFMEY